jgi:hypothetical protein
MRTRPRRRHRSAGEAAPILCLNFPAKL